MSRRNHKGAGPTSSVPATTTSSDQLTTTKHTYLCNRCGRVFDEYNIRPDCPDCHVMLTSREIVVPRPSIPLKLTHAQLLPYIKRHQSMWIAKWRRFDPTYNRDRELERMEQLGGNYQLPPIGLFTFILIATVLMTELFKSEGIENNKANMNEALDQFEAAIRDPQVVAQL